MEGTTRKSIATTLEVTVVLTDAQYFWLREVAAEQVPPLSTSSVVGRLVDQATAADRRMAQQRADQLEIYEASGYTEHRSGDPARSAAPSDV